MNKKKGRIKPKLKGFGRVILVYKDLEDAKKAAKYIRVCVVRDSDIHIRRNARVVIKARTVFDAIRLYMHNRALHFRTINNSYKR